MSIELLQQISIVSFLISGVLLIISVVLFFKLKVKDIVNDLSGKIAAQQIRKLREGNMQPVEFISSRDLFEQESKMAREKLTPEDDKEDGTMLLINGIKNTIQEETSLLREKGNVFDEFALVRNEMEIHTEERI